ncbi:MAG: carboxypeptidase-like regulatory domain-containing protein [Desulfobacterales bacterium]
MNRICFFAACLWVLVIPFNAFAHGTDYRLIGKDAVVAAEFFYSDNTPMQYADVLVFSPENDKVEYQNGRTDQNGRFAFLAETPGKWHIKVNDGMGHAVRATVTVSPGKAEPKTTGEAPDNLQNEISKKNNSLFGETSMGIKLVFGLSILMNIFLCMYVWKRKRHF